MLHIFRTLSQMSFRKLMMVYEEENLEDASLRYSAMDKNAAILQAEQDFYAYPFQMLKCFSIRDRWCSTSAKKISFLIQADLWKQ